MTCHDARELLSGLVDEALTQGERATLDAHLEGCADCRRELDRFRRTVAVLRAIEPARAPVDFVDRVVAAARPTPWYRRLGRWLFVPLPVKLPIEAAAMVLVAVSAVYVYQRSPELQRAARQDAPLPAPAIVPPATAPPGAAPSAATPAPLASAGPPTSTSAAEKVGEKDTGRDKDREKERAAELREAASSRLAVRDAPDPGAPAHRPEGQRSEEAPKTEAPAPAEPRPLAKAPGVGGTLSPRTLEQSGDASEEKTTSAPAASVHRFAARALISVDVSGRLVVKDRRVAGQALADLIARLGGTQLARRPDPGGPSGEIVEMLIPRTAYAEFTERLGHLGEWLRDTELPELPEQVRVVVRLTD